MKMDIVIKDVTPEQASLLAKMLDSQALTKGSTVTITDPNGAAQQPIQRAPLEVVSGVGQHLGYAPSEEQAPTGAPPSDLDANGFPWNEKIHSGNQQKTAKGVWTRRRGVEDAIVAQVEGELRAAGFGVPLSTTISRVEQSLGIQPPAPPAPPSYAPPASQFMPPPYTPPAPVAAAPVYTPPAPPAYQPPPAAPVYTPPAPIDFNGLMQRISQLFSTQQITPDYLQSLTQRLSQAFNLPVNAITDIAANPAMIGYAFDMMRADGKA